MVEFCFLSWVLPIAAMVSTAAAGNVRATAGLRHRSSGALERARLGYGDDYLKPLCPYPNCGADRWRLFVDVQGVTTADKWHRLIC